GRIADQNGREGKSPEIKIVGQHAGSRDRERGSFIGGVEIVPRDGSKLRRRRKRRLRRKNAGAEDRGNNPLNEIEHAIEDVDDQPISPPNLSICFYRVERKG